MRLTQETNKGHTTGRRRSRDKRAAASAKHPLLAASTADTQHHVAILALGVSIWNRWRASEPLTVPNLQNADLSGLVLENVNLAGANLRGADFSGAYLYDADFQKANLEKADLTRAVLIGANFHGASLVKASLEHAYIAQSDLSNANLTGACLQEADLKMALLTQTLLSNASVAAADMAECIDLTELQLKSACDGHLAYLESATLEDVLEDTSVKKAQRNLLAKERVLA
ncbi:MAG: pentapeptide repeat-containing protein [Cyanobacteria bacterium J06627_32]